MSDPVTNPAGNADSRSAPAGFQNVKVPLSDLFANVLNKTTFAERMLPQSEFVIARAAERDFETRPDAYETDSDYADVEPADDGPAEVSESDDQSDDGTESEAENQPEGQPQDDSAPDSQQVVVAVPEDSLLALNPAAHNTEKPGLTVQPNAASGVVLQEKAESPTPGQAHATTTAGQVQAAAHKPANTNSATTSAQDASARNNAALGQVQSGAGEHKPDAAAMKVGLNVDAATAKHGLNIDIAAAKPGQSADAAAAGKPQANGNPLLTQAQAATSGDGEGLGTALERHALLISAGAKRAVELHEMKIRLMAHRDAIKKVIAQSAGRSNGAQPQNTASSAGKPSIEVTTSATPPAPLPPSGPAARPTALFNPPAPGSLPGQAGNGSTTMIIGDTVGNGAAQSTAAADRQTAGSNTARGLGFRSTPPQLAYQPAEQIKVHIQQMVKSGADRIQVRLSPASLGRIEVALEISPDKAVQAIVYAEKPETLDMLERDARVLQKAFEEAGMKFDSDGLTFKHGQSGNADPELAAGTGSTEDGTPADGDALDAGESADNDQPSRRPHDGMLDLEI